LIDFQLSTWTDGEEGEERETAKKKVKHLNIQCGCFLHLHQYSAMSYNTVVPTAILSLSALTYKLVWVDEVSVSPNVVSGLLTKMFI
jgi:hypothetical protein